MLQFRTCLGQVEDMSLSILTLKVKLGFFVGFKFGLPALQTVDLYINSYHISVLYYKRKVKNNF